MPHFYIFNAALLLLLDGRHTELISRICICAIFIMMDNELLPGGGVGLGSNGRGQCFRLSIPVLPSIVLSHSIYPRKALVPQI